MTIERVIWTMVCTRCDHDFRTAKGTEQLCSPCVHAANLENIGR